MRGGAVTFQLVTGGTCMTALGAVPIRHDWRRAEGSELAAALAEVSLFAKLGRRPARKIARHAELARFVPGDVVLDCDAPIDFFYVVLCGAAELREEGRTYRLRRGDSFGELDLLGGAESSATVIATDETRVVRLPVEVFRGVAQATPDLAFAILKQVGRRVQQGDRQPTPRAA
jgi:CRP-like cAMP-binding protein